MLRFAKISPCLNYRYALGRLWDPTRPVDLTWCMLNPSTADGTKDDPTIRQCIAFAQHWGFGGMSVVNLFAYRTPNPRDLLTVEDPVGPDNDLILATLMTRYHAVVTAWGSGATKLSKIATQQIAKVAELAEGRMWCFGVNASGHPSHPLYIARDKALVRFTPGRPRTVDISDQV
jgi:hypothetical protein